MCIIWGMTEVGVMHVARFFSPRGFCALISTFNTSCQKMYSGAGKASTRLQQKTSVKVGRHQWGVNVVTTPSQHAAAVVWWGRCSPFKLCLSTPAGHFLCYLHFFAGIFWLQNGCCRSPTCTHKNGCPIFLINLRWLVINTIVPT